MNHSVFLHIVERLESLLGRLPEKIQKPILQELTPMKELFLKQRAPRFVLTGSHKFPLQELVATLFAAPDAGHLRDVLMEVYRWHDVSIGSHGSVALLDARGADAAATQQVREELQRQPGDVFLHLADGSSGRPALARDIENLAALAAVAGAKVVGISLIGRPRPAARATAGDSNGKTAAADRSPVRAKLEAALQEHPTLAAHVVQVLEVPLISVGSGEAPELSATQRLMSLLVHTVPNEARVEMIRVSRDKAAQQEIAETLVKSTSAVCAAIGAQPIPLADLPILTTLQLVMVSGIMHIAGRERSLRMATEFAAALGVNVGAGMLLREGARAVLKFVPGWGNVVCGMVAGAGTYALGRAAMAYFLEGVTLKDARRAYRLSRRKPRVPKIRARQLTRGSDPE